ncbi:MAG: hypothetical protein GDA36_06425 [Rhodobacteraceae bacterium]|nr:hypothetical protein [Paracoccaceae bacterium]
MVVNGKEHTLTHLIPALATTLPEQYQKLLLNVLLPGIPDKMTSQTALSQSLHSVPPHITLCRWNYEHLSLCTGEVTQGMLETHPHR